MRQAISKVEEVGSQVASRVAACGGSVRVTLCLAVALLLALLAVLGLSGQGDPTTPQDLPHAPSPKVVAPSKDAASPTVYRGPDSTHRTAAATTDAAPDVPADSHELTITATTKSGDAVTTGTLRLTVLVASESQYSETPLSAGKATTVVPHGAVLSSVELAPLQVRLSQLGWEVQDVCTSGFLACDLLEQWQTQPGFQAEIEAPRTLAAVVETGIEVTGCILDAATGRGIEGAWVLVECDFDAIGAQSDADGQFTVRGREPLDPDFEDELKVTAHHPRYRSGKVAIAVTEAKERFPNVPLRLAHAVRLSGTIIGHDGQPMPDALVQLMTDRSIGKTFDRLAQVTYCRTNERGQFDLWGLQPTADAELVVRPRGAPSVAHTHGPFSLLADQAGLLVALPAMARVKLRLLLPGGGEADPQECIVAAAVAGEIQATWQHVASGIKVPVGPTIEWTAIAQIPGTAGKEAYAVIRDHFASAGDHVRTLQLQAVGAQSPWSVSELTPDAKDKQARSGSMNVISSLLAHSFQLEVAAKDSGQGLGGSGCRVTTAFGSARLSLNEFGRMQLKLPAGRQWCRVEVDGYEPEFFHLRAPAGGSSRLRILLSSTR